VKTLEALGRTQTRIAGLLRAMESMGNEKEELVATVQQAVDSVNRDKAF
jgi:hypothetical protein